MLNIRVIREWIDALRSGKYVQAGNRLRNSEGGMCCLGVLCDLYREEHPKSSEWGPDDWFVVNCSEERFQSRSYLPKPVMEWAGLGNRNPQITCMGERYACSCQNDDREMTFEQIADGLEAELAAAEQEVYWARMESGVNGNLDVGLVDETHPLIRVQGSNWWVGRKFRRVGESSWWTVTVDDRRTVTVRATTEEEAKRVADRLVDQTSGGERAYTVARQ